MVLKALLERFGGGYQIRNPVLEKSSDFCGVCVCAHTCAILGVYRFVTCV